LVLILVAWEVGTRLLGIAPYLLPRPSGIVDALIENREQLVQAFVRTALTSITGLFLAILIGVAGAVLLGMSAIIERSLFPYAVMLQTIPTVAIAPILVIWIGPGFRSIVAVSFIISFFPMFSNASVGLHSTDPEALSLFRLLGASRWKTMWKLRLPGAMPYIMAGVRISAGLSVIGAIVGEFVAGTGGDQGGLGFLVSVAATQLKTAFLMTGALAAGVLGVTYYIITKYLSRRVLAWHESTLPTREDQEAGWRIVPVEASGA
jgi:NitT/TauT family transport system permease protein